MLWSHVYRLLPEGRGLSVGEALAIGKAAIGPSEGSLPELGGSLVRFVDAWEIARWAAAL